MQWGHLAEWSHISFKSGSLKQLPRFRRAWTPTWQQQVMAVGPGPVLVWPGWTGRPRGTVLRSQQQGPRPAANGSGGGIREI